MFFIAAAGALAGALGVVILRNPFYSVLALVVHLIALAVLFLLLSAEFLAAAQVIVYAGAVMVLFLFVIMLLNAGEESKRGRSLLAQMLGIPGFFALLVLLAYTVLRLFPNAPEVKFGAFTGGGAKEIGRSLFTQYLLPFEVTSVLILIAILGAIVLARKEID